MTIQVRDNRGGNWWWAHNVIFDVYGRELGPYGIAVYCCLARHAGQEQSTWIGQRAIAEEIGCGRTSVQQALAKLRELALLDVEEQQDERGQLTNVYTLLPVPGTVPTAAAQHPRPSGGRGGPLREQGVPVKRAGLKFMEKTHENKKAATDEDNLWGTVLADLQEQIVPTNFARWLAPTRLVKRVDGRAVVGAPDQVTADQLARRFDSLVRRALEDACGEPVAVEYQVAIGEQRQE